MNFQKLISAASRLNTNLVESLNPSLKSRLSSSPLSTAVAIVALGKKDPVKYHEEISRGIEWLISNINTDGGWGDTPGSLSNLSTTLLCWSALNFSDKSSAIVQKAIEETERYISEITGAVDPDSIIEAVLNHYGKDQTFSVPILALCAISGRLGDDSNCWDKVPQLPFELAVLPGKFYSSLNLNVVSYALPALIAIGLVVYKKKSRKSFPADIFRKLSVNTVLKKAKEIQPVNGGYLEAIPLTGFVSMSLISAGFKDHDIVNKCTDFLISSLREDGSWPIDSNLDIWVTTLTINNTIPYEGDLYNKDRYREIFQWIKNQQFREIHPFTGSKPGGWSWTDLPGGVPDADDTSGAILALHHMSGENREEALNSASSGIRWLMNLQNRDGGLPTFCRGWGKLPFDRSCPDITAHAMRATYNWYPLLDSDMKRRVDKFRQSCSDYLKQNQLKDGSWLPLWFGNQWNKNHENPVYGTSQVLFALSGDSSEMRRRGCEFLLGCQNSDGGWGNSSTGSSTFEETGLSVSALLDCGVRGEAVRKGVSWLTDNIDNIKAAPIGLYFASLWYYEEKYPLIFTAGALNRMIKFYREEEK